MNNKIILSIHHKYSELILTEKKTLEIRKSAPRRGAWGGGAKDTVFLYETKANGGAGAVVGFFSCGAYEATNAFTLHAFNGKEELRRSFITRSCLTEDELVACPGLRYLRLAGKYGCTLSETSHAFGLRLNTRSAELAIFEVNKKGLSSRKLDKPRSAFVLPINYIYKYSTTAAKSQ